MEAALFRNEERAALIESLENMLRPLMPVLLRYGVTLQDAHDALRALYIDELSNRSTKQGRPLSETRLGMLAGINRGEIQKLLGDREEKERLRQEKARLLDQATAILGTWNSDRRFITPYGAPLDLSLEEEAGFRTFDELLQLSAPEADRKLLIEVMVATGCVEIHSNKFIRCTNRNLHVGSERLAQIARIGRQCGALASTVVHNLFAQKGETRLEARIETSVVLSEEFRAEIEEYVRSKSNAFMQECDTWISEREHFFVDDTGKKVGLGLFYFEN